MELRIRKNNKKYVIFKYAISKKYVIIIIFYGVINPQNNKKHVIFNYAISKKHVIMFYIVY